MTPVGYVLIGFFLGASVLVLGFALWWYWPGLRYWRWQIRAEARPFRPAPKGKA